MCAILTSRGGGYRSLHCWCMVDSSCSSCDSVHGDCCDKKNSRQQHYTMVCILPSNTRQQHDRDIAHECPEQSTVRGEGACATDAIVSWQRRAQQQRRSFIYVGQYAERGVHVTRSISKINTPQILRFVLGRLKSADLAGPTAGSTGHQSHHSSVLLLVVVVLLNRSISPCNQQALVDSH